MSASPGRSSARSPRRSAGDGAAPDVAPDHHAADGSSPALTSERKAELVHRLRRAEGQVRGLQKLLEEGADCAKIAQQLLAARHALDSTYVRLNLAVAEREIGRNAPEGFAADAVSEALERLQYRLGRAR